MKLTSLSAVLIVAAALLTAPGVASAAPAGSPLPDANLFCGANLAAEYSFAFGYPSADAFWITDGPYAGRWNILVEAHYMEAPGLTAPIPPEELTGQHVDKTFGTKAPTSTTLTCEVVSRWPDYTIIAPMTLGRV